MSDLLDQLIAKKPKGDPLDEYLAEQRAAHSSVVLKQAPAPDVAAQANVIARQRGVPATIVEQNLPAFQKQDQVDKHNQIVMRYPAINRWASDPRNAMVAADDNENLGILGSAFEGLKNFGASLKSGLYSGTAGLWGAVGAIAENADYIPFMGVGGIDRAIINRLGGKTQNELIALEARQRQKEGQALAAAARPDVKNWVAKNLLQGVESVPLSLVSVGAGVLGSPAAGVAVMGGSVGGNEYVRAREAGLTPQRALVYGTSQGLVEYVTEKIPAGRLAGDLIAKSPIGKTLMRQIAAEVPGEQVATVLQDFNEWATLNPDKPFSSFLQDRPRAAAETLVATLGGMGATTGISIAADRTARATAKVAGKLVEAKQAKESAPVIDKVMEASANVKTKRDPEAFAQLIKELADDAGTDSIYVPADAINSYMQSDGYDGSFDDYSEQVSQGLATGGDVVFPMAEAVTRLAPIWDSVKDDARLTAGGFSRREAQSFDEAMADAMAELTDKMAEQDAAEAGMRIPRDKLFQSVSEKLTNAGFTPSVAMKQAELLVQRAATRATRLGRDLTGNEYDSLAVRQVLPERLARVQKADQIDILLNAVRRGAAPVAQKGPSILDFIARAGGIEDKGGDIKAMGGDSWHREKPFRKRLIRASSNDQGSLMGAAGTATGFGLDDYALKLWEAGYFPDMMERPSVNDLLDAIGNELSGNPTFANAVIPEDMAGAAEELRMIMAQAGIDETASKGDIKSAIDRYVLEQSQGQGYDQVDVNSEAFKKWFAASKVVDAQGKPLVVYHGTRAEFDSFDKEMVGGRFPDFSIGIHFSSNPSEASLYADSFANMETGWNPVHSFSKDVEAGANVVPVYLRVENPLVIDSGGKLAASFADDNRGEIIRKIVESRRNGGKDSNAEINALLKELGDESPPLPPKITEPYDGIIIRSSRGDQWDAINVIVFEPTQIKSVNNRGTFDPADPRILYQSAYHGSPHIFDKFSLDKIGTGEGAQAYGWGLYFAGKREIAEHYRRSLSEMPVGAEPKFQGQTVYDLRRAIGEGSWTVEQQTMMRAMGAVRDERGFTQAILALEAAKGDRIAAEAAEWLRDNKDDLDIPEAGRLYEVEIPEDDEYLLWDEPLSEQPEKVRAALEAAGIQSEDSAKWTVKETAGGKFTVYNVWGEASGTFASRDPAKLKAERLTRDHNRLGGAALYLRMKDDKGSPQSASLALHKAGIAGIKYLDGGSRKDGDGTYNYVVFDDSRVSIQAYDQSFEDAPRGRITFPNAGYGSGPTVIDLFQSRDQSTFLHEAGHLWLEELRYDASGPQAPQQLKDDWQAVTDWFAANGHPLADGMIPVEAHEMWARGVERYLMEGKSPVTGLKKLFADFKAWLVQTYRTAARLNAPISDEVRAVIDRLIATDEEINNAMEEQALISGFPEKPVTMTDAEWADYQKLTSDARDDASTKLLAKTMATIKRRVTKEYKSLAETVRAEVATEIDARPEFKAINLLKASPMDAEWVRREYGEDALSMIPKSRPLLYKDGGADPDAIAELAGFASGDDMVRSLMGVEERRLELRKGGDQRSVRQVLIDQETDARMLDRYGDPFLDGSIEEEALAAVHNEKQGDVLAAELRVIARGTGERPTPYSAAKEWASRSLREGVVNKAVSKSAMQNYQRAASRAGKAAFDAVIKGDMEEAFRQKQAQMLNNALVSEAKKLAEQIEKAVGRLEKIATKRTIKSVDQDYLERAQGLLEQVDMRARTQRSIDKQEQFEAWAQGQEADGHDIVVPASFAASLGSTHWSRLTVEQFLGLDAAVDQIIHLGRFKQKLIDNGKARDFEELVREAEAGGDRLGRKPPSNLMEPDWKDRFRAGVATFDASLLKMETVFDWLDDGNSEGVFNRIVFRPIAEAEGREKAMLADYYERIRGAFAQVDGKQLKRWQESYSTPELMDLNSGLPYKMKREHLIAVALNMGNEGNIQRLVDGYGWNEQNVRDVLNRELSQEDWAFVQSILDIVDTLWPEIAALERRVNGVEPERVEAMPIETPFGTLRGGYYPAVYDTAKDYSAEVRAGKESDLLETTYTRATTRASSTKDRAARVKRPILLQLGVINRHIGEVIHDITHREAVMQANKFLSSPRVMKMIDETLNPEIRKQMRPWLKFVANQWAMERAGNEGIGKWLGKARANTTIVGMGFRASTILTQIAGYSNSYEYVGAGWVNQGIARTAQNPIATFDFVMERSAEIRGRMDSIDRDIRATMAEMAGSNKAGNALTAAKRFAFHGIGYMDRVVVIPTWIGAYNKALSEGMDEADAIYAADKAVRLSQGSGSPKDLASVQRGTGKWGEALKFLTMFYTYMSAFYQRERTLGRDISRAGSRDVPALMARAFWLIVVPPVLSQILSGNGPGEDDDWGTWTFKQMLFNVLGPIPIVRDAARPIWDAAANNKSFGYQVSPVQRAIETISNVAGDIGDVARGDDTKRMTRNTLEAIGYTTGLVPGQFAAAAQFLVDVGDGDQNPQDISDWYEGLTKGKISDE